MPFFKQSFDARGDDLFAVRVALVYLAIWPTFWGLLWVWTGFGNGITRFFAVALVGLLFLLAGIGSARSSLNGVFAAWQKVCLIILVTVYVYGSLAPTHDIGRALAQNVTDIIILVGAFGFFAFLRAGGEGAIRSTYAALIAGMALYVLFVVSHFQLMLGFTNGRWIHAFLPFGNVRIFTNVLAPVSVLALGLLALADEGVWTRRVLSVLWVCFAAVLFWTGGRAPVLAIGVTLILACVLGGAEIRRRVLPPALWGAAAGSLVSLVVPVRDAGFGFWQRLIASQDAATISEVSSGRLDIWRETLGFIAQKPLLGHGTNQWIAQTELFEPHGSTHNFPLQVVHDYGLIGGGAAMLLVFGTLYLHLRRFRAATPLYQAAIMMLCVMAVQSFFDAIFSAFTALPLVFMAFGLAHVAGRLSSGHTRTAHASGP